MFNFFYILYDQPDRKAHSNPLTIATMKAARNAAAITITKVKDVCAELIEGESKVIIGDKHISDKILDFYNFMCPFAAAAPLLDLEYYEKLLKWKTINSKQAFNLMTLARKHFWYLSPKLVP